MLYQDAAERERMYDVMSRLRVPYMLALAAFIVPAGFAVPVYGWVCLLPLVVAVVVFAAAILRARRSRRHPERGIIAAYACAAVMIMAAIALADGPKEYLFSLPIIATLGMSMVVGRRMAVTGSLVVSAMLVATALLTARETVTALPPVLILPVTLIIISVLAAMATYESEFVSRSTAVVDPLTGLLNRVALQTRATELALHARAAGERVALIVADVDHFKAVNDRHGHVVGDAVLAEVARRLRTEVGARAAVYRFGGEEFVVLLSGATRASALALAERLREAVSASDIDGVAVTASLGVAAAAGSFTFEGLFARADAALYAAKAAGRDQVRVAPEDDEPAAAERRAVLPQQAPAEGWDVRLREATDGSWLMPNAIQRAHGVDALERIRRPSQINTVVLGMSLVLCGFWITWWPLLPAGLAAGFWELVTRFMPRARRPEYGSFAGISVVIVGSGVALFVAEPVALYGLPMVSFAVLAGCAGYPRLGATLLALIAATTTVAVGLLGGAAEIADNPVILALPLAYVVAFALIGWAMGRATRGHRVAAITDPLTGALNRSALDARIPVLEQQGVDRPIGLLVADLDRFKEINDEHGHDAGDAVLREAAERIRGALRAFDSFYRVGGEEFVVLLTDSDAAGSAEVAARVAAAFRSAPLAGVPVTVSIGVATAAAGDVFSYDALFARADAALYRAKQEGRDRVVSDDAVLVAS